MPVESNSPSTQVHLRYGRTKYGRTCEYGRTNATVPPRLIFRWIHGYQSIFQTVTHAH